MTENKGDLISREALSKSMRKSINERYISWTKKITVADIATLIFDEIDNTPTVEQKYYERVIAQINPVIEARPQGEWIEVKPHQSDLEDGIDYREECSICHEPNRHYGFDEYHNIKFVTYYKTNFCPNCGAEMVGGES